MHAKTGCDINLTNACLPYRSFSRVLDTSIRIGYWIKFNAYGTLGIYRINVVQLSTNPDIDPSAT
ncbi:hypothetical protein XAB3213_1840022 [Xanthomonas citri pv. bilvae]|nr:hypothetical protein XAB3213_1840022 [Xanthomonas citri pv. bilvae]